MKNPRCPDPSLLSILGVFSGYILVASLLWIILAALIAIFE